MKLDIKNLDKKLKVKIIITAAILLALIVFVMIYFACRPKTDYDFADANKTVITLTEGNNYRVQVGTEYVEPGYTAIDPVEGDITSKVRISGRVDTKTYGNYILTYSVTNSAGYKTAVNRIIHVTDLTPPTLTLNGLVNTFIKVGSTYEEPGYSAIDSKDGDITNKVKIEGSVDANTVGVYNLTYTVTDSNGNVASATRLVRVVDNKAASEVNPGDKIVYLTFDDGPGEYTMQLLDILDKYGVKVTFFVTHMYPNYENCITEEAKRGHTVGIHSASHVYKNIYSSVDAYYADMYEMSDIITNLTGKTPTLLRFPGGGSNEVSAKYSPGIMTYLSQDIETRGLLYCDWNVLSGDAGETKDTNQIVQNVIDGMQKHNISYVLQHDVKDYSVNAVERILQWGLSNGYTFLPLTDSSPMWHHPVHN